MQEKFTKASIDEPLLKSNKCVCELEREVMEFKKWLPEGCSMPCGALAASSVFMTMVVVVNWGRLEQSILMGTGDMSKIEVIFKLGLWLIINWLTGLLVGAVFRLRYPFLFGVIVVSASSFTFLSFMTVKNADAIIIALLGVKVDIPPWRAYAFVITGLGSYFIILVSSMMYLRQRSRAEFRELYPGVNIDFTKCEGPSDPEKNIGAP